MVRNSSVKWAPAMHRFGQKFDHAMLSATWRWRTKKTDKFEAPDYQAMDSQSWDRFDSHLRIKTQESTDAKTDTMHMQSDINAAGIDSAHAKTDIMHMQSDISAHAKTDIMRPLQWTDVLRPRIVNAKTSTSLPSSSPIIVNDVATRVLINYSKQQQRRTHVNAFIGQMFDLSTEDGRRRQYLKQSWTYIIACGAMVEPPPSNIPEIIVPPGTKASSIPLPKSYVEAVTGPYRRYWIEAIRVELENLLSRKVWREEKLPKGSKPVPGRYVWKVKPTDKGKIQKWKVRWIVQGFRQRAGHDYDKDKLYASAANVVTVRSGLAIACEL